MSYDWSQFYANGPDPLSGGYGPGYGDNPFPGIEDQPSQSLRDVGAPGSSSGGNSTVPDPSGSNLSGLSALLRQLGLTNNSGDPNAMGLLSLFGPLLGGILSYNSTGKGANQVVSGLNNASDTIKTILGNASPYAPYASAGADAVKAASGMNYQPLSGRWTPLGQPKSLSSILKK